VSLRHVKVNVRPVAVLLRGGGPVGHLDVKPATREGSVGCDTQGVSRHLYRLSFGTSLLVLAENQLGRYVSQLTLGARRVCSLQYAKLFAEL
jgi:hypothetical protein